MSTLEIDVGDIRPISVAFTADELVVTLADGRRIATPLAWYPRLRDASASARGNFELMAMGIPVEAHFIPGLGHGIDDTGLSLGALALQRGFS